VKTKNWSGRKWNLMSTSGTRDDDELYISADEQLSKENPSPVQDISYGPVTST